MNIEYYLLLSENPIDLAGGWGWRRVYIKNLKESGRAHPGRAHPENKKKNNLGRAHPSSDTVIFWKLEILLKKRAARA